MATNDQYRFPPFGMSGIDLTGAPGSQVAGPESSAGPVIGEPVVSAPFDSSQVAASMPRVPVMAGDTCSMPSDAPVPASGDPMTGLSQAFVTQTGAGQGSAGQHAHPNAGR